jgi:hypothetical protein
MGGGTMQSLSSANDFNGKTNAKHIISNLHGQIKTKQSDASCDLQTRGFFPENRAALLKKGEMV